MSVVTACPDCHARSAAHREHLGHRVRCPFCHTRFTAAAAPFSLRRLLRRSHPAGRWLGVGLLALAPALAAPPLWAVSRAGWNWHRALFEPAAAPAARHCFFAALAGLALGGWLVARWRRATER
jgi:hypothetical protein